jgi:hypothetical protein
MVKLSNKQPYIIHDINSDFRVVEYDGVFKYKENRLKLKFLVFYFGKKNRRS